MGMAKSEKGMLRGWRALLAMALTASLALGMTPLAATEAHAATKTKTYVYDVVYGTYQGKYAIGFNLAKKSNRGSGLLRFYRCDKRYQGSDDQGQGR